MPTTTGEVKITFEINEEVLKRILELKEYQTIFGCVNNRQFTAKRKNGLIIIAWEECVELEFDMSDYAPDNDWRD